MATGTITMEQDIPGWAKMLGGLAGGSSAAWFVFRRIWSSENVALAGNKAQAELIDMIRVQVEKERQRADFERQRADTERERNSRLMKTIDAQDEQLREMSDKLQELSQEVAKLRAQVAASLPSSTP